VKALGLALGLLVQHGNHFWGFVQAQACKPHLPPRFWRLASRAEMRVHIRIVMQALEVRIVEILISHVVCVFLRWTLYEMDETAMSVEPAEGCPN